MNQKISLTVYILVFVLTLIPFTAQAQTPVYTSADRQTLFNDITDNVATLGMDPKEKQKVKNERRASRRFIRLEKARDQRNSKTQKQLKRQQKAIMNKIQEENEAKDNARKERNKRIQREMSDAEKSGGGNAR